MGENEFMDRNLALELVRVTEAAALASSRLMGKGDEKGADQLAVDAMRKAFDGISINGTVVIGEGERDEAPMLYIGEKVGRGGESDPVIDIALDPLEGTTICARGGVGATSVVALAEHGGFLHAPDTYMDKIAVGPKAKGLIDIDASTRDNLQAVAKSLKKSLKDVTVVILNRPRHEELIRQVREQGARIHLIDDGDVSGAIATSWGDMGIDMMMGTGGAPEGVIAAAALRCIGGDFQGRLNFRNDSERERATKMGVTDLDKAYKIDELASGDVMFSCTGVTHGPLVHGVVYKNAHHLTTQSIIMRSKTGTVRMIDAHHNISLKKIF